MKRTLLIAALAALSTEAAAQASQPITVSLTEWKIGIPRDTVQAGAITFRVNNNGAMNHALYVKGEGVDKGTREIPMRQSVSLTATLKPGTYELYCPMSDESHKLAGMKRTLVVTPASASPAAKPDA